jgi:hypothetical protein
MFSLMGMYICPMSRIAQLIEEIKELKEANNRSTLQLYNLLENNKQLFLSKLDPVDFRIILKNFEQLSETHPKEYGTPSYKSEFQRAYELLSFHLNRII